MKKLVKDLLNKRCRKEAQDFLSASRTLPATRSIPEDEDENLSHGCTRHKDVACVIQLRAAGHVISWEKAAQLHLLSRNSPRSPQLQIWLLCALLLHSVSCSTQQRGFLGVAFFCCGGWEKSKYMSCRSRPWKQLGR